MKNIGLLLGLLLAILSINGAYASQIDCGNDFSCFVNSSQNCTESHVEHSQKVNFLGVDISYTADLKIKQLKQGECKLNAKFKTYDMSLSSEMKQYLIAHSYTDRDIKRIERMTKSYAKRYVGNGGVCQLSTADLNQRLINWQDSNFTEFDNTHCRGRFFFT